MKQYGQYKSELVVMRMLWTCSTDQPTLIILKAQSGCRIYSFGTALITVISELRLTSQSELISKTLKQVLISNNRKTRRSL